MSLKTFHLGFVYSFDPVKKYPFENILEKGENAYNVFPTMFSALSRRQVRVV